MVPWSAASTNSRGERPGITSSLGINPGPGEPRSGKSGPIGWRGVGVGRGGRGRGGRRGLTGRRGWAHARLAKSARPNASRISLERERM
jgi:hypothetical protein